MRVGLFMVLLLGRMAAQQDIEEQEEPPILTSLPDVLIGDPNDVSSDEIGPAITDEEFAAALADSSLLSYRPENITDDISPLANQTTHFQGDIQIRTQDQFYEIMLNNEASGQSSAISNPSLKWPNKEIPYYISSYFYGTERAVIVRAMAEYHKDTCLKFVPRTTQRDYIHIMKGQGCSSSVGRVGGVQTVSLGYGCVQLGTAIHELMHAAGFWHEQSRYDRDSYVLINYNNIQPGLAYNFNRKTRSVTQDLGLPYDYKSVMHYDQYAFAWNRRIPTIYPRQNGASILGQKSGFSELDKMGLNLLYQCSGKPNPKPSGCKDNNRYCSDWAKKGYCMLNSAYMHVYCKKSCDTCDKTVKPEPPKPSPCVDVGQYCEDWAAAGHCVSNAAYMKVGCKKSCNLCGTTKPTNCVDNNKYCADWASKGQCKVNPAFMKVGCPKSCNTCNKIIFPDKCVDTNAFCPDWSVRGYCRSNPSYMHTSCRKSCNKCTTTTTTTSTTPTTSTTTFTTTTTSTTTVPPTTTVPSTTTTDETPETTTEITTTVPPTITVPSTTTTTDETPETTTEITEVPKETTEASTEMTTVTDSLTNETITDTTVNPTETSTDETTKTTVTPTEKPEPCEDDNEFCSDWASIGHCESNSGFMHVKCKKSCDRCNIPKPTGNCLDDNEFCPDWSTKGYCESNAEYMKESCKRSCKICEDKPLSITDLAY